MFGNWVNFYDKGQISSQTQYNIKNLVLKYIENIIKDYIDKEYKIILAGHSKGGGEAIVAAAELKKSYPQANIECYTFGAAQVGDEDFNIWFNENVPNKSYVLFCPNKFTSDCTADFVTQKSGLGDALFIGNKVDLIASNSRAGFCHDIEDYIDALERYFTPITISC